MIRSRLLRLPGLLHAVVFALTASSPGLPHGCELERGGDAMAMSPAVAHQHSHQDHQPHQQKKCHCLGECCRALGGTVLPPTQEFQLASSATLAVVPPAEAATVVTARPRFLQPPALGPPFLS